MATYIRPTVQSCTVKENVADDKIDKALHYLFEEDLPPEKKEKMVLYINQRYHMCECVVLSVFIEPYAELCKKLGLNSGKKEVQITTAQVVLGSSDYRRKPTQI